MVNNNWIQERNCKICTSLFLATHPRTICCSTSCKEENNRINKARYQRGYIRKQPRESRVEYSKLRRYTHKEKLFIHFGGRKCMRCGIKHECSSLYEVHHTVPEKKEFNIGKIMSSSWAKIEKELEHTILLCANCHRIIHWELKGENKND